MHEMGIVMQIIETATSSIPAGIESESVEKVNLKVGRLSCVMPENLRFCFKAAIEGTPLAGAELNIEEIPVTARCNACNYEWTINEPAFVCKKCNAKKIEVISGRELEIVSIDIAD
jgi:hydrogenase nickel incorporation protein HypA/HybF